MLQYFHFVDKNTHFSKALWRI